MCRILIQFTGDPFSHSFPQPSSLTKEFFKVLCNEIVYHQEEEIEFMNAWLQARDLKGPTMCSSIPPSPPSLLPLTAATCTLMASEAQARCVCRYLWVEGAAEPTSAELVCE